MLLTVIAATSAVTFTHAQTAVATGNYLVPNVSTTKCTIVDNKPTATMTTVVDNGTFKTSIEAETGMKTIKVCAET